MKRFAAVILFYGLFLFASLGEASSLECRSIHDPFQKLQNSFDLMPSSLQEAMQPLRSFKVIPDNYALGGLKPGPVRDQCQYGSCWAHATLAVYEQRAFHQNGMQIALSEDYLIARQLLEMAQKSLDNILDPDIEQGYSINEAEALIQQYGMVPASVFTSKINFKKDLLVGQRFILNLNLLVQRLSSELRQNRTAENKLRAKAIILEYIQKYMGPLPENFTYQSKVYTPQTFAAKAMFHFKKKTKFKNERISKSEVLKKFELIKKQLDETGEPVRLAIFWAPEFVDNYTGSLSFKTHNLFSKSDSELARLVKTDKNRSKGGMHAVDIVDYQLDEQGRPVKLLILNSWSDGVGDRGYFHIYWDYFEEMASSIYVMDLKD